MAKFSKFNTVSFLKRAIAIVMVLAMVVLAGCGDDNVTSDGTGSTSSQSGSPIGPTASGAESVVIDPLEGEISHTLDVVGASTRTDDGEFAPESAITNLKDKRTGYLDAEADALRKQIVNTGNTEEYYTITGTKYYVSPGGKDGNDGLSPESPFASIDSLAAVKLKPGDAVLFERDSIFRMTQTINCKEGVIYGSYGTGAKPKLYGSGQNFANAEWTPTQRKNVWKTSYIYDKAGNIIFDYGEIVGYMRQNLRGLTKNYQFYQSEEDGYVYLYCDKGNPSKVYKSIEIASGVQFFTISGGVGNVTIDNICMLYTSGHGISGLTGNHNITVTNCEMGYIGGVKRSTHRLGNAIQMWAGVEGFYVKNNWIYQTFDSALTWQGSVGKKYTDIRFENNLLEYNHTDIEFWDEEAELGDFVVQNNMFRFTQLGWGSRADDGGIRGFDGVFFGTTSDMNQTGKSVIKNNVIDSPAGKIFKWTATRKQIDKWEVSGNSIYINAAYRDEVEGDEIIRNALLDGFTGELDEDGNEEPDSRISIYTDDPATALEAFKKYFDPTIKLIWK